MGKKLREIKPKVKLWAYLPGGNRKNDITCQETSFPSP